MTSLEQKRTCVIYPENPWKNGWDIFAAILLMICVFWTPWEMCFNIEHRVADAFNWIVDAIFLLDMTIIFMSAHTTEDFEVIDDHATIAIIYLKSWFWIDLLAILPFKYMMPNR